MTTQHIETYADMTEEERNTALAEDQLDPSKTLVAYTKTDPRTVTLRSCFYCGLVFFALHHPAVPHVVLCPRCLRAGGEIAKSKPASF